MQTNAVENSRSNDNLILLVKESRTVASKVKRKEPDICDLTILPEDATTPVGCAQDNTRFP